MDATTSPSLERRNILVVDDNPNNLRLLADILKQQGYAVRAAPNGELALRSATATPPDLVLLDILLPDISGIDVCARLKENPTTRDVPVIFISALGEVPDKLRGFQVGGVDYLTKPLSPEEVLARVNSHLTLTLMRRELEQTRDQLEEKVRERTLALEQTVAALEVTQDHLQEAKEAAEAASRAKSHFLAVMSHEIRTPMNAVIGMGELLGESSLQPEQRRYVDILRHAGEHLMDLINDILDFSKMEAGEMEVAWEPFHLLDLVEKVAAMMAIRAREKGVILNCRVEPGLPSHLVGDYRRLRQVLVNLLGNAVKFTEEGEVLLEVTASARETPLAGGREREGCCLKMVVKDTGIGINEADQEQIFGVFTQVESTVSRTHGGTGLGLAITRRLVDLMGGEIQVESRLGEGSAFTVRLCLPLAHQPPQQLEELPAALRGVVALVVDDNTTNRMILREVLQGAGMQVLEEPLTGQALQQRIAEHCRAQDVGVILLDYHMPVRDGLSIARELREDHLLGRVPVMVLSSDQRAAPAAQARAMGIPYFLRPVSRQDLFGVLARMVSHTPEPGARGGGEGAPGVQLQGKRILLAEDAADNVFLLQRFMEKSGVEVVVVGDGREAVAVFQREPFHLVLMDIQMPVMDGYQATRAIRDWERQLGRPPTPILALTAFALSGDDRKSLDAGCDGHLVKPIKRQELLNALLYHLGGNNGQESGD